jgi:phage-related protein
MTEAKSGFMCPFFMECGEACDVVSPDYLAAAKLLDEYQQESMDGKNPDKQEYLARCPESQKEEFSGLLEVSDFLSDHYNSQVSEETVNKAMARIAELREEKKCGQTRSV